MARLVKLTEGIDKEFWSIFFSKLISEYIQDKKFFDMLCTITYPFDDFCRIVHKAYQNTLEEINEISDPSLQNWLLVKKLKSRIVQSPNTTLLEISDKVIITIKEELMKKEKKYENPATLWDKAKRDEWKSEEVGSTFSYIEIQENESRFRNANEKIHENEIPISFFKTALKAEEVSIKATEQFSNIINNPVQKKLVKYYIKYIRNEEVRNAAYDRYLDFKKECTVLLKNDKFIKKLSAEEKTLFEKIINHSFKGMSFPSFPGLISVGSCPKFLNLHEDYDKNLYCFRIYGEGWNKEKTILPLLINLQEWIMEQMDTNDQEFLEMVEDIKDKLFAFSILLGFNEISYKDFEELFDKLKEIVENCEFPEFDHYLCAKKEKLERIQKINISPKQINPKRLIVFIHENIYLKKNEGIDEKNKTSIWYGDKEYGLQEFITYLIANTEFFPEEIEIYHKRINTDLRERLNNDNYRFFASLKAVIDSAILYLINDPDIKQSLTRLNHEFRFVKGGDNIWFIPYLSKKVKRSLFHEFYYMLLKGVHSWETKYFEYSQGFSFDSLSKEYKEKEIRQIIKKIWQNKSTINRSRRRINVQMMTKDGIRKNGNVVWSKNQILKYFDGPFSFYTFDNIGKVELFTYQTASKEKKIALPGIYLYKFLSNYHNINKAFGRLFMDEWYFTSHSLKNTSTAGYTLHDKALDKLIKTKDILLLSLSSEKWVEIIKEEQRYIRNIAAYAHLTDEREINVMEENFIEDSFGNIGCDINFELASLIVSELAKEDILILIRAKHSSRTESTYDIISESVNRKIQDSDLSKEDTIIDWIFEKNKQLKIPLFVFNEKAIFTPSREIGKLLPKSKSNRQLIIYINEPLKYNGRDKRKIVGMLIFGSRREEKLEGEIKKDLQPSLIFTVIPYERSSEETISYLKEFSRILTIYGDEKGGISIESLKRLFHLPYPDSKKLLDPSIFIKGINRIKIQEKLI
ncbi:MAG: hypothetical protein K9W45_04270 [Candidatus Heimdallarchaeum aukensis]|uniref:Uncharacterized protein n=1 Tax=Candidatus Heimdallarchaeum aukensis TaxID=2876573 RepID=A0A9Y1FMB0_9ARCH|nr:MAG: hypothetical protein K9W45_04270 [Candidatus Heimdallarchaeum aukensis]